ATRAVEVAREPGDAVEGALPSSVRERYVERRASTPGDTGLRLGIGEAVVVTSLLLALAVILLT
ncbi:MAG: hypothetical protein ACOCT0_04765, partial [Halobacteriota archaeon]